MGAADVEAWFAVGAAPKNPAGARSALENLFLTDSPPWPIRLVAFEGSTPVARLGGYVTATGRLSIWFPDYSRDAPVRSLRESARAMLAECLNFAASHWQIRYAESKPATDVSNVRLWLAVLEEAGFRQISEAKLFTLSLTSKPVAPTVGLRLRPSLEIPDSRLAALLESTFDGTFDRADAQMLESSQATLEELRRIAGPDHNSSLWQVIEDEGELIGCVFCSADEAAGDILHIGVVPRRRQTGMGALLLSSALSELFTRGVCEVRALIDLANYPSIALHERFGFRRLTDVFWIYRAFPSGGTFSTFSR